MRRERRRTDRGDESAAVVDTLIGTARQNDIGPFMDLRKVFECIADHPINRIDELFSGA
jgi:transposase